VNPPSRPARARVRTAHGRRPAPAVPRPERVYVNRNLRFSSISAIGFDLDHTLAHYDPLPVERLAFEATVDKLVRARGYPAEIRQYRYDPAYVIRGLVVDRDRGNVLKMDYFNFVTRGFHGRQRLSTQARRETYRAQRFILSHETHVSVDTLFHLPEVYLFMCLVELLEQQAGRRELEYSKVYGDVRAMIDEAHRDGSIKQPIMSSPEKFLRRDSQLAPTLEDFRRSGKKLFLLTNSELYYTDALMSYLLPPSETGRRDWREFFDLIMVSSGKPGFFLTAGNGSAPAELVDQQYGVPAYSGGDAAFLQKSLEAAGDRILYFGDHTYGDILRSKRSLGWRTAMIVPEVAAEVAVTESIAEDLKQLAGLTDARDRIELKRAATEREFRALALTDPGPAPAAAARRRARLEALRRGMGGLREELARYTSDIDVLGRKCSNAYNRHWGSLFREDNEITRFGHQLKDFACLYTSRVSNFLHYPSNFYFRSPVGLMPHEM